jgi:pyruvate kinase
VLFEEKQSSDELFETLLHEPWRPVSSSAENLVVLTAGLPLGIPGMTNILKVHIVGNVLTKGIGVTQKSVVGNPVCLQG